MSNRPPPGVSGGFAPPTPSAAKSVSYAAGTNTLQIQITPPSSDLAPASLQKGVNALVEKDSSVVELIEELQSILKSIPTENPRGSEDIYGFGTTIVWGSDELEWENLVPAGCGGASTVQATDEDKEKFKRALRIADDLVAKGVGS